MGCVLHDSVVRCGYQALPAHTTVTLPELLNETVLLLLQHGFRTEIALLFAVRTVKALFRSFMVQQVLSSKIFNFEVKSHSVNQYFPPKQCHSANLLESD